MDVAPDFIELEMTKKEKKGQTHQQKQEQKADDVFFIALQGASSPLPSPDFGAVPIIPVFCSLVNVSFDEVRCPIRSNGHMLKEERGARCAAPPHAYSMKGTTFL